MHGLGGEPLPEGKKNIFVEIDQPRSDFVARLIVSLLEEGKVPIS